MGSGQTPEKKKGTLHMNDHDQRLYDRATRVQTFGIDNAADFADGGKAKTHFANIDDLIGQTDEAKAGQKPNRVSKETLLASLSTDLQNIARTARRIGQQENGFAVPYRIPDNTSESSVTTHADTVLLLLEDNDDPVADGGDTPEQKAAKAALRARFVEYEMKADFVAILRADRDAISEANRNNQTKTQGGVENTELVGQLLGQINFEVAELDAIMNNKYDDQPAKLRAWQSASHVERAPRAKKTTPPTTKPTPPTP
jgi:hypothetical protein